MLIILCVVDSLSQFVLQNLYVLHIENTVIPVYWIKHRFTKQKVSEHVITFNLMWNLSVRVSEWVS